MNGIKCCIKAGRRPAALLAALLMLLALPGCGGKAEPTATATPSAAPTATAAAIVPREGGSISLSMPQGVDLANPLLPCTREVSSIYGLIYSSMLELDDSGAPAPCLAENWTPSDDGLQWKFTVRTGVKWSGLGRDMDGGDIVFTLDQIKALGDNSRYRYVLDYLDSWQKNDDGSVTIKLKSAFYGALHALMFPVLPAGAGYDGGKAPATPAGTGPYIITSYSKGKEIDLKANTDWWKKTPYISQIKVLPFPDNATAVSSLVLRQLDAVQTDDLNVTQYRESGDANLYEYPTRYFEYMVMNFTSPDIKEKRVRQAIAYALDRREIVAFKYFNHAIVSDTPVPPDSWLYDGNLLRYNNNEKEARRLLRMTGWKEDTDGNWTTSPDGVNRPLKLTLLTNRDENNTLRSGTAESIADQLKKAGFQVEIKAETWDEYTRMLGEGLFDIALCGSYLSPVPDYRLLLGTSGALNYGKYSNEKMDALLDDIMKASSAPMLKSRIGDLQTMVIDELPIISLYFRTHSLLTSPKINNVSGATEESAFNRINQWFLPQE